MDEPLLTQPGGPILEAPPAETVAAGYGEAGRLPIVPPQPDSAGLDDLALNSPWPTVSGWWMLGSDGD